MCHVWYPAERSYKCTQLIIIRIWQFHLFLVLDYAIIHFWFVVHTHAIHTKATKSVCLRFRTQYLSEQSNNKKKIKKRNVVIFSSELSRQYHDHFMHVNVIDNHHFWPKKKTNSRKRNRKQEKTEKKNSKWKHRIMDPVDIIDSVTKAIMHQTKIEYAIADR